MAEGEDTEYLKLPIEDRCVHKLWKARQSGFEDAKKTFAQWDGDDANWKKYSPIIKKFVTETNALVLEKGLEAALVYVENCDVAGKNVSEIMDGLVNKCIGAPKAKTKDLAKQISVMLCEIEVHEKVIEDLIKGLSHKNPKIISGCLSTITECLRCFGAKVIRVSPLLKATMPLLDHRDKTVREEGKHLIIESYRWVGDIMKQQLTGLKPVQLTELDGEFEKVAEAGKAKPERLLRSQQAQAAAQASEDAADGDGENEDGAEEVEEDPYDCLDPVDILSKLPKNFYELVEEKKWQLRKEALDALLPLSQSPKISSGDFGDLARVLKKFISKDTNVMLVALASQCLAGLANGLRNNFRTYAVQLLPVALEKFKEKKINVVNALVGAVDAMYPILGIEAIQEDCLASLKHKTPTVNSETAKFLARCFAKCPPLLVTNKKILKGYVSALLDKLTHSDVNVRDAASEALGTLMKFMGESTLVKFMPDLDSIKMTKIKEFEEKAVLSGKPASAIVAKAAPAKPAPSKSAPPKSAPARAGPPAKKPGVKPKPVKKTAPPPKPPLDDEPEDDEPEVKDNVQRVDLSDKISESLLNKMSNKDWKLRKEAMEELKEIITTTKFFSGNLSSLGPVLSARFSDTNKIIAIQAIETTSLLATALGPRLRGQLSDILPGLLSSLSDMKVNVRTAIIECLEAILSQTLLKDFFADEMILNALSKGNQFTKQEIFKFLTANMPDAKKLSKEDLSTVLPTLYSCIEDRNADVRKCAQEVVPIFMRHLGYAKMSSALDRCKPGTKNTIAPILEKARETVPEPETKRNVKSAPASRGRGVAGKVPVSEKKKLNLVGSRPATAKPSLSKKKGEEIDTSPPYISSNCKNTRFKDETKLKSLKWNFTTPRQEFVEQLKDQMIVANLNKTLITQMFHSDFKQHLKAIETLSGYVDADVDGLIANLDLILKWITLRFFETNPSVLLKSLDYLNNVFSILVNESYHLHDIEAISFIPYLVNKVGDPKDQVRSSIKNIFKLIYQVYPGSKMSTHLTNGLSSKNAKQRAECLDEIGHLIQCFGTGILQPTVPAGLKEISKHIADRDNSVRNAALNCMTEAYFQDGDKIYKVINNMPEKDLTMLEERIKRQSKNRPPPTALNAAAQPQPPQQTSPPREVQESNPRVKSSLAAALSSRSNRTNSASSMGDAVNRAQAIPTKARPISGAFTLDLQKIESAVESGLGNGDLKLVNHNLDDIFKDDPVRLPNTYTARNNRNTTGFVPSNIRESPPKVPMQSVSDEMYEQLDLTLSQIYNQDSAACISALQQMDELIKNKDKVYLISQRMDKLLIACYMQYRHVLKNKMSNDNFNQREVQKILQYITVVLMSSYHYPELTKKASVSTLHDLLHIIICILVESKLDQFSECEQISKALNILAIKILERSDHTYVTSAFIKLFKESIGNSSLSPKYIDLVTKCLWKVTRNLPLWKKDISIDTILCDIHEFFGAFPSAYWKKQVSQTPMQTMKTLVHVIVQEYGDTTLNRLNKIQDPENSELLPYIKKLLKSGVGKDNNNADGNQENQQMEKQSSRFSKSDHEILAEIFKKIGQKESTKQGIQELYNFKQQNPNADLEPFLTKASHYFRDYIERGLETIAANQGSSIPTKAEQPFGEIGNKQNKDNLGSSTGNKGEVVGMYSQYLDRLKKLRAQSGLDTKVSTEPEPTSVYRLAAPVSRQMPEIETPEPEKEEEKQPESAESDFNIQSIRERLQKIKSGY